MKKIIICFVLWLCTISAFADENDTIQFTEFGFKGKVKNVTCFYSKESFGEIEKISDTIYVFCFDELGNPTRKIAYSNYDQWGNPDIEKRVTTFTYEQKRIQSIVSHADSIVFNYNEKGELIDKITYVWDWDYNERIIYKISNAHKFKYNADSKVLEDNYYRGDGSLQKRIIYKYDNSGLLVNKKIVGSPSNSEFSYVYSTTGKLLRDSCNTCNQQAWGDMFIAHKYFYDETATLKKVDYDFGKYIHSSSSASAVKVEFFPHRRIEYVYDSYGKEIKNKYIYYHYSYIEPYELKESLNYKNYEYIYNSDGTLSKIVISIMCKDQKFPRESYTPQPQTIATYICDIKGNWTEKKVYEIQDGVEFFKEGIIREISYYE